jgi:hypothetical protein
MAANWIDKHLKKFVKPHLGYIPKVDPDCYGISAYTPKMLSILLTVWEEAKRQSYGRKFLLTGRDTWEFEVLARLDDFPTIYRPDISSSTKDFIKEDYSECYLLDSGNMGTVPKALGIKNYHLVLCCQTGQAKKDHQILYDFPRRSQTIERLYTALEDSPKYWTSAYIPYNKKNTIHQILIPKGDNFAHAAMLTMHIANAWKTQKVKQLVRKNTLGTGFTVYSERVYENLHL